MNKLKLNKPVAKPEATLNICLGSVYTYKNNEYQVIDIAVDKTAKSNRLLVIYYSVDDILTRYAREVNEFKSKFKLVYTARNTF